ncbi:hypothetical protein CKO44_03725 [Rubrivivax gelatinosus]|uniref:hypothetical protein n=1 Tax=Rubrivivax gelatinosus TaxID=28068 RepID=UPI00190437DE|nr:hypothetical protein [Rubrivivax gelatinosus]MBK1612572.1 hypothetical protein [Rubrivivax gelatinosus]
MKLRFILTAVAACALAACGKPDTAGSAAAPANPPTQGDAAPTTRQSTSFGSVSSIVLEPLFQVPARYAGYVRQEVSEAGNAEIQKMPDALFDRYGATWLLQAASVEQPDWLLLARIRQPALTAESNAFKKQEAADRAKAEARPDRDSLNVVFGWMGEIMTLAGPDLATGEYYLTLNLGRRFDTVFYSDAKGYNYRLHYEPSFKALGLGQNCSDECSGYVPMTVKVPIEKAREIEALREHDARGLVRVYGHVTGLQPNTARADKSSVDAALVVEVQAIEVGTRQDGAFKPYFFLDTDQLKRWKP